MKIIAIIPARHNSKRIKNKNLLKINNKSILEINYKNLKKTKLFKKIILTSESSKIKKIAKSIGYDHVIDRPKKLSKDSTSTASVVKHAINFLKNKIKFTHVCCVYPMAIMIKKGDLLKAKKILNNNSEIIFPAIKYKHPIQRAFKIKKNFVIEYKISKKELKRQTQTFDNYFHDAGQFYFGTNNAWKNFDKSKKKSFEISNLNAVDVDYNDDFKLLKAIYNYKS